MENADRCAITRAALLLALSTSDNCHNAAFRLLVQRGFRARHDELEAERSQLRADALRELARLLPSKAA